MNKNRKIVLAATILLLAGAGVGYYFINTSDEPRENIVNYDEPTKEQLSTGQTAKKEFLDKDDTSSDQQDTPPESTDNNISVQVSSMSQRDGVLKIRTIIQDVISGSCKLTLKQGSAKFEFSADTQNMGSYSVCKGFDVPVTDLSKGEWQVQIDYTNSDGATGSAVKQVTIQ
ncbi:MAG: hypothetical protein ABIQ64_01395 [Candidatus Saccharimonadales bacterium]